MLLSSPSQLTKVPKRIISLVPSQTELLYDLGLDKEVIGLTKFCIHPQLWRRNKIRVGGTKNIDIQKIISLQPDLIIANKEENTREQIETLTASFPVWLTEVKNFEDALKMISDIGLITNTLEESDKIISQIKSAFNDIPGTSLLPCCYLIWKNPFMTVGGDTFISDLLGKAGFRNVFAGQTRYPEISVEDISQSGAKILLLSSEPFPFQQQQMDELQTQLPGMTIKLVDGEMFSWYGSRLTLAADYFKKLRDL